MKSKLIILVGPPLSGKDTYLRNNNFDNYTVISRDDILMSLYTTNNYSEAFNQVDQKEVDSLLNQKIQECVLQGTNVIINMTNLTGKSRRRHLSKFNGYEKVAIVFPKLSIDEYVKRNNKRKIEENKFIPVGVIQSMIDSWKEVTEDEGFDKIIKL
jgi:predicted kinase